jgi:cbb3-type cytochrome oxidase maturation protein
MNVIFLLIAASTMVAVLFLAAFTWAVRSGQFDDDRSPAVRILGDAKPTPKTEPRNTTNTTV